LGANITVITTITRPYCNYNTYEIPDPDLVISERCGEATLLQYLKKTEKERGWKGKKRKYDTIGTANKTAISSMLVPQLTAVAAHFTNQLATPG
jgi:hypothetical protein